MGPLLLIIFTLLPLKGTSTLTKILDPLGISESPFITSNECSTDFLFPAKIYFDGYSLENHFERILIVQRRVKVCL